MTLPLRGVLPIVHTPFDDQDNIHWDDLQREIDWGFAQGIDGLGTGMVSETIRLTAGERIELHRRIVEFAAGRGPVFASVGAESDKAAVEFARAAEDAGCSAIMALPPLTTRLPAAELFAYFSALARSVSLPLIVQDASGYVGNPIPVATAMELLNEFGPDKIVFKPEASPPGPLISQLAERSGGTARLFEGSGGIHLVDSYRRGVQGTMPGMEIVDAIVALWRALNDADEQRIYALALPIGAFVSLQLAAGLDGFLAAEKHILHRRGLFSTTRRRRPYAFTLDEATTREIDRLFEMIQIALGGV